MSVNEQPGFKISATWILDSVINTNVIQWEYWKSQGDIVCITFLEWKISKSTEGKMLGNINGYYNMGLKHLQAQLPE